MINDNGGKAKPTNWILTAAGPTKISGRTGSAAVTNATVQPGSYKLSESKGPGGYKASPWTCVGARVTAKTVRIVVGAHVVCTITNNDKPGCFERAAQPGRLAVPMVRSTHRRDSRR